MTINYWDIVDLKMHSDFRNGKCKKLRVLESMHLILMRTSVSYKIKFNAVHMY